MRLTAALERALDGGDAKIADMPGTAVGLHPLDRAASGDGEASSGKIGGKGIAFKGGIGKARKVGQTVRLVAQT